MATNTEDAVERVLYSVPATCEALGIGRATFYELMVAGQIRPVKIGRRTLVSRDEILRFAGTLKPAKAGDAA